MTNVAEDQGRPAGRPLQSHDWLSPVERIRSMTITGSTLVADIATQNPATIKVFQRHRIDFCCGGKVPLEEACRRKDLEAPAVIAELDAALLGAEATTDWAEASLTDLGA